MTGNAAKLAVQIIDTLATRSFGVTVSSIVVNKEYAFLCHKCRNIAENSAVLMEKVRSAESGLVNSSVPTPYNLV